MDQYEVSNATIQARHPKMFKNDTYIFDASKELVMCMPFDFINSLTTILVRAETKYSRSIGFVRWE
jgi:hypothetical protein